MAAIGPSWADGAWVKESWIFSAWGGIAIVAISVVAAGVASLSALYVQFFAPFVGGSGLGIPGKTRWKRRKSWKKTRKKSR